MNMKKWMAMLLSVCLALTAVCAGAETLGDAAREKKGGFTELLKVLWSGDDEKDGALDMLIEFWRGSGKEDGVKDLFIELWNGYGEKAGLKDKLITLWSGGEDEEGIKDLLIELWSGDGKRDGVKGVLQSVWNGTDEVVGVRDKLITLWNGLGEGGGLQGTLNSLWDGISESDGFQGMLGLLGGGEPEETPPPEAPNPLDTHGNIVPAQSKDVFFGVWTVSRLVIDGAEFGADAVAVLLGGAETPKAALTENSLTINFKGKESSAAVVTELKDGALSLVLGSDTQTAYLTDSGEVLLCLGDTDVYLTSAQ